MPLPTPVLDDRTYQDLMAEALTRIPRYTPEWTDFNDSDPGITLVQLHAWLTELLIYRINQVPDLAYVKFLELIGLQLRPAEPARAELTFTVVDPAPPIISVPLGTRVAGDGGEDQPPVVFETDRTLQVLGPKVTSVLVFDGFGYDDVTAANQPANGGFQPFGPIPRTDSALLLGYEYAGAFPDAIVDFLAVITTNQDRPVPVHCDLAAADTLPPAVVVWEYWDGIAWEPLGVNRDDSKAFSQSGHIELDVRGSRMQLLALPTGATPRYWLRARLDTATYEIPPRLQTLLSNTVSATQAETVRDEVVGGTSGVASQQFQLFSTPVLDGTLVLQIDEGSGFVTWTEVDDLYSSGPDDLHYTLDRATGTIGVGDGVHGHLPVANPQNPLANVVATVYRYGGGSAGNLGAGAIAQLQSAIDGIDSVTNLFASEGGVDDETLDDAKARAPQSLKTRDRAVTVDDFELLAQATPGAVVARAIAQPRVHPSFPGVDVPGSVTVIVIPENDSPAPMPSEATLHNVCAHLGVHRLLTTELHVTGPTYRKVRIDVTLEVNTTSDLGTVRSAVVTTLNTYFHALTGGEDGTGWPLGGAIPFSLVYKTVLVVPGVAKVDQLLIWLDDDVAPECQDVTIGPGELLYSDAHNVIASYRR
jgi:predicted phage baseplate assembly protein